MTNHKTNARPLAGGDYIRDEHGLRQVEKPTAPHPGKSAARKQAQRTRPAPVPKADQANGAT